MYAKYYSPVLMGFLFLAGCGLEGSAPSDKPAPPAPQMTDNAGATKPPSETKHADTKSAAAPSQPANPSGQAGATVAETKSSTTAADSTPGAVREAAHVGMGEKGRGYGNGYVAVTLKAYWNVREVIVLDQIKHAMDLYKVTEGHYPKDFKEFQEKILNENHLQLPQLPPDHHYVYDPNSEEYLMVETPAP